MAFIIASEVSIRTTVLTPSLSQRHGVPISALDDLVLGVLRVHAHLVYVQTTTDKLIDIKVKSSKFKTSI